MKEVDFIGKALDDLRDFPDEARQQAGYQIDLLQRGGRPVGAKPMGTVGQGCQELVIDANDGWFRVFYVTKVGDTIVVLHAFQKKTNQTSQKDIKIGQARYKIALETLGSGQ
ncbi:MULTISPECIES: type II toxin-antitoxin system RelE/ParE family toxin [unclassified Rhodococcus (in: high G+C Gram-positive bacteria)]|uniref:type II toxin-antitoxin system RelE/ParE family toxin n=1 Tax=unclassified Rhodococcus (in: high G+C Gram-positive bacteria) TaxID=192944 RepID=UPI0024B73413|nr:MULTISPECIES: type II toxin-antitoxin system RelE/ParE family toxin [unclassified Rhodococcus (in: high G+C Gram-positive bacteria)]MDI9928008.1 type II toxin-antitoxin system RelE/ParE family toxin [Rhodococcus sp. IEGM 1341]MDV8074965.1 type II toxin-antitoxin system RelE/ParE family toxin [Rhodococcus sp. IEGM 1370]